MKSIDIKVEVEWLTRSNDINGNPTGIVNETTITKYFLFGWNYRTAKKIVTNIGEYTGEERRIGMR